MARMAETRFWQNIWQMNRSAKRLLIVSTILDDFSLVNR